MILGYIVPTFPAPSETFISREVLALRAAGFQVHVFACRQPAATAQLGRAAQLVAETRYVERDAALRRIASRDALRRSVRRLNDGIQAAATVSTNSWVRLGRAAAIAADVRTLGITHLHAHWPYPTQIAQLVSAMTGVPFSVSIHAHEVAHNNGHFALALPEARFATFCNRAAMRHLLERHPIPDKAHLVYHGVELDRFTPVPLPQSQPLHIVSAGRLTRTKGFDRLIGAVSAARAAGLDVRLTILGDGDQMDVLAAQVNSADLQSAVTLAGWVAHDSVRDYLESAHLFALLADVTMHDGLPNVVLEAMAVGRPVILSPLPAATEAVTDGVEGFVLNAVDDEAGFVDALQLLADDPERVATMGQAARARVLRDHDAARHIETLITLFKQHDPTEAQHAQRAPV